MSVMELALNPFACLLLLLLLEILPLAFSFFFGYMKKSWYYIFFSLLIAFLIYFLNYSPDVFIIFVPGAFLLTITFLPIVIVTGIILHYMAWWVGYKVRKEKQTLSSNY